LLFAGELGFGEGDLHGYGLSLDELGYFTKICAGDGVCSAPPYVSRSQVSRVMAEAGSLKTAVEACLQDGRTAVGTAAGQCDPGATGSSLLTGASQTSQTLPTNTGVPQVLDPLTTQTTIIATFGNGASAAISGQTLTWTRDVNGGWSCATTVDAKFRPNGCTD
ncbi:pilin, partial [Pseudomonas aeruginosa]|nr:pilin [Pseudomonas aeruginosa]MBN0708503.1 pilin [Pseudomonas aeruginosa]